MRLSAVGHADEVSLRVADLGKARLVRGGGQVGVTLLQIGDAQGGSVVGNEIDVGAVLLVIRTEARVADAVGILLLQAKVLHAGEEAVGLCGADLADVILRSVQALGRAHRADLSLCVRLNGRKSGKRVGAVVLPAAVFLDHDRLACIGVDHQIHQSRKCLAHGNVGIGEDVKILAHAADDVVTHAHAVGREVLDADRCGAYTHVDAVQVIVFVGQLAQLDHLDLLLSLVAQRGLSGRDLGHKLGACIVRIDDAILEGTVGKDRQRNILLGIVRGIGLGIRLRLGHRIGHGIGHGVGRRIGLYGRIARLASHNKGLKPKQQSKQKARSLDGGQFHGSFSSFRKLKTDGALWRSGILFLYYSKEAPSCQEKMQIAGAQNSQRERTFGENEKKFYFFSKRSCNLKRFVLYYTSMDENMCAPSQAPFFADIEIQ